MHRSLYEKAATRLPELPAETLAAALLDCAAWSLDAANLVETLITNPEESVATFKRRLAEIGNRHHFYSLSEASLLPSRLRRASY